MLDMILRRYIILSSILYASFFMIRYIIKNIKPIVDFYSVRSILYGVKNWESKIIRNICTEIISIIEVLAMVFLYILISAIIDINGMLKPFSIFIIYICLMIPTKVRFPLLYTNYPNSLLCLNIIIYILMKLIGFFVLFISENLFNLN